jgi:hypothetical protein
LPAGISIARHGECQMSDERYCRLYNLLRLVHASDLWSFERFKAIVRLNSIATRCSAGGREPSAPAPGGRRKGG